MPHWRTGTRPCSSGWPELGPRAAQQLSSSLRNSLQVYGRAQAVATQLIQAFRGVGRREGLESLGAAAGGDSLLHGYIMHPELANTALQVALWPLPCGILLGHEVSSTLALHGIGCMVAWLLLTNRRIESREILPALPLRLGLPAAARGSQQHAATYAGPQPPHSQRQMSARGGRGRARGATSAPPFLPPPHSRTAAAARRGQGQGEAAAGGGRRDRGALPLRLGLHARGLLVRPPARPRRRRRPPPHRGAGRGPARQRRRCGRPCAPQPTARQLQSAEGGGGLQARRGSSRMRPRRRPPAPPPRASRPESPTPEG